MSTFTETVRPSLPTPRITREFQQQQLESMRPGFAQAITDAAQSEWVGAWAANHLAQQNLWPDPDFKLTDELMKELGDGIPDDLLDALSAAHSLEHAKLIRKQLLESLQSRQRLESLGWTGVALRLGAAVIDPVAIAAVVASEGAAGPFIFGTKMTRMQRMVRYGLLAAGENTAIEAALVSMDPSRDASDLIYAAAAGLVLGGGMAGAFPRLTGHDPKVIEAAQKLMKDVERADAVALGLDVTPNGARYFWQNMTLGQQADVVAGLIPRMGLGADEVARLRALPPRQALEEMTASGRIVPESAVAPIPKAVRRDAAVATPEEFFEGTPIGSATMESQRVSRELMDKLDLEGVSEAGDPTAFEFGAPQRVPDVIHNGQDLNFAGMPEPPRETEIIGRLRFSMVGRIMRSESSLTRRLARMIGGDSLAGTRPGDFKVTSAFEWVTLESKTRMARWYRSAMTQFDEYAKSAGIPAMKRFSARTDFMADVGKAVRRMPGTYTDNAHVNAVADMIRKEHAELLALAQRYQVKGFADVPESPTYLMRVHNRAAIDQLVRQHGSEQIEQLIAGAIRSASDNLDEKKAAKIARGYLRTVMKLGDDTEIAKARMFSMDNAEGLARALRDNVPDITDAEVEDILYAVAPRGNDANLTSRARRRLELDETYSMTMPDGSVVSIEDLLENNAETLMNLYTRQIVGASAISQVMRDLSAGSDKVIENWRHLQEMLIRDGASAKDIDRLETLYKGTLGHRLGDDTKFADALRMLRKFQFMRIGNQFGFAQIAELGNVVSATGFRAITQQMPILPQIFKKARDGRLADEFLDEIEAIWGSGTDFLRNQVIHRLDNGAEGLAIGSRNVTVEATEALLGRGQRLTTAISGMATITTMQQRLAMAAGIQKWMNLASKGRPLSARRLATMGLTPEMGERVMAQMRKHVKTESGVFGRRVRRLNLDSWDDLDAASHFIGAMDTWSRRVIQENDLGNMAQWMTTDLGKTLIQFRAFAISAWEKQFLFNVRMHDAEAFGMFAGTMTFAGLAYVAQQYVNSIGRPDRREYLERRLATGEIAKAAFQRAGWASLWPTIIDSAAPIGGYAPQFSYGRSSQLAANLWFGNPTIDMLFNQMPSAARSFVAPMRGDYQFSQRDLNALGSVLPFQNMIGIANMIRAMGSNLPEQSRE